jgi:hypothetical protein
VIKVVSPFLVKVIEHSNNVIYNFFQLKGGEKVDLTDVNDTTDFIYYSAPQLEISSLDTNLSGAAMLNQPDNYSVKIKVFQEYDGGRCYLDTAQIHIENGIADVSNPIDTLMIGGSLTHRFAAGEPNLVPPHLKTLTIQATANEQSTVQAVQAVVLGKRAREVNFSSTMPEIPLMILRDPPGDASSASIEKGTTSCTSWSISNTGSQTVSLGLNIKHGAKTKTFLGGPTMLIGTEVEIENNENIIFHYKIVFILLSYWFHHYSDYLNLIINDCIYIGK